MLALVQCRQWGRMGANKSGQRGKRGICRSGIDGSHDGGSGNCMTGDLCVEEGPQVRHGETDRLDGGALAEEIL